MKDILLSVLIAVVSYLIGSLSTGIILSGRHGVNIREEGSHNPGASNVLRIMGLKSGVITFFGDSMKAALACTLGLLLLPSAFGIDRFGIMLGGLFAVLGHNWPVYYGFRGGKGVACSAAVILFVHPLLGAISIVLCLLVVWITRYISVGSMTMLFSFLILNLLFQAGKIPACIFAAILFLLCVYRHKANIIRLANGNENKIGTKRK